MPQVMKVGVFVKKLGISVSLYYYNIKHKKFPPPHYKAINNRPILDENYQRILKNILCNKL